MDSPQRRAAKAHFIAGMQCALSWQEAAAQAGLQISQATAYRLLSRFRTEGAGALEDGRHGHSFKLREPVRQWLAEYCRASLACTSWTVQAALFERFGVWISIPHLNRVRAALGDSRGSERVGEKSAGSVR